MQIFLASAQATLLDGVRLPTSGWSLRPQRGGHPRPRPRKTATGGHPRPRPRKTATGGHPRPRPRRRPDGHGDGQTATETARQKRDPRNGGQVVVFDYNQLSTFFPSLPTRRPSTTLFEISFPKALLQVATGFGLTAYATGK